MPLERGVVTRGAARRRFTPDTATVVTPCAHAAAAATPRMSRCCVGADAAAERTPHPPTATAGGTIEGHRNGAVAASGERGMASGGETLDTRPAFGAHAWGRGVVWGGAGTTAEGRNDPPVAGNEAGGAAAALEATHRRSSAVALAALMAHCAGCGTGCGSGATTTTSVMPAAAIVAAVPSPDVSAKKRLLYSACAYVRVGMRVCATVHVLPVPVAWLWCGRVCDAPLVNQWLQWLRVHHNRDSHCHANANCYAVNTVVIASTQPREQQVFV